MGTSLGTRNNITKWIFVPLILILNYLSGWNGYVAKENQLGNFKKSIFTNGISLGTRNNIIKWIFIQIILI